jgi:lysophospholipase L1-like esterase
MIRFKSRSGLFARLLAAASAAMVSLSALSGGAGGAAAFAAAALCLSTPVAASIAVFSVAVLLSYPFFAPFLGPHVFEYAYPLFGAGIAGRYLAMGKPVLVRKVSFSGPLRFLAKPWVRPALAWIGCISAALTLFNAFPLVDCIAGGVAAFLVRSRIIPETGSAKATVKGILANTAIFLVAFFLALAIVEIGARILINPASRFDNGLYMTDERYIFTLRPGATIRHEFEIGPGVIQTVRGRISDQGLRDEFIPPKEAGEYRVLLLGDSYTFGVTTEFEDTIGRQLQRILVSEGSGRHVRVINLGVGGTGPWQQRGRLLDIGFELKPDLVVHQLFLSNDVGNTLSATGERLEACNEEWEFTIALRRMYAMRRFRAESALRYHSAAYSALVDVVGRDKIVKVLAAGAWRWSPTKFPVKPWSAPRLAGMEVDLDLWYPALQKGWDRLVEDVAATAQDCAKRDVDYVVYNVPYYEEMSGDIWSLHANPNTHGAAYERGKAHRLLKDELRRRGVGFIPTFEIFREYEKPEVLYYADGATLYDGHLSPAGNGVIARLIADYIRKAGPMGVSTPLE